MQIEECEALSEAPLQRCIESTRAILRLQVGWIVNAPLCVDVDVMLDEARFLCVGRVTVLKDTDPAPLLYAVSVSLCRALLAASARSRCLTARKYCFGRCPTVEFRIQARFLLELTLRTG
jgi:hypothetical protein